MTYTKLLSFTYISLIIWGSTATAAPNASVQVSGRGLAFDIPNSRSAAVEIPEQREPQRVVIGELRQIDELIAVTENSLTAQQQLKEMLGAYQHTREIVLDNPRDNEALYRQSLMAKRILDQIENNHFDHLFSREFLSELHLFARVANKHIIPRP